LTSSNYGTIEDRCQVPGGRPKNLEINPGASGKGAAKDLQVNTLPGRDELASSGSTWATVGDSSPIPGSVLANSFNGVGSNSLPESRVVVGGACQGTTASQSPLCTIVAIPPYIRHNLIINLPTIKALLQPKHRYFKDKQAYITELKAYKHSIDDEKSILYPVIKGDTGYATKNNPYRKYQLSRSHSGRTVNKVKNVIDNMGFDDFRMCDFVLTMPDQMSKKLAKMGKKGREIVWRCQKRMFNELPGIIGCPSGQLAGHTNLHTWSSKNPLKAHYHFHCLIPNYISVLFEPEEIEGLGTCYHTESFEKWFGGGIVKLYRGEDGRWQRGCVPFSDGELNEVKKIWTRILKGCCRRNGIRCSYFENKDSLADVYVAFTKWDDGLGRMKLINKINYQKRHWLEDYARYSNDNTYCKNPSLWLEGYINRTRPQGWWCRLSDLSGESIVSKDRISVFTGEPMFNSGSLYRWELMSMLKGEIGTFEVHKGRVIFWLLDEKDKAWLYHACKLDFVPDMGGYGAVDEPE
jgi:hypothetical protein